MPKALLIVDVQNDFCEGGALGVEGGHAVADKINEYLRDHLTEYALIVASHDWHQEDSDNGGHIAIPLPVEPSVDPVTGEWVCGVCGRHGDEDCDPVKHGAPDYVNTWPPHCIQGTNGADLHDQVWDALDWVRAQKIIPVTHVYKGDGVPAYSAFEGVTSTYRVMPLTLVLERSGISDIDVVGIATDHCVRASVMDALSEGHYNVRVLSSMIAGVNPERSKLALEEMAERGAQVVG